MKTSRTTNGQRSPQSKWSRMFGLFLLFVLFTFANGTLSAQLRSDEPLLRVGAFGGANLNRHTANFPEFVLFPIWIPNPDNDKTPRPPNFQNGSGIGFTAGVLLEIPLTGQLALLARASYSRYDALLTTRQDVRFGLPQSANTPASSILAPVEFGMAAQIPMLGIDALAKYTILGGLHLSAGIRSSLMMPTTITQQERLLTDASISFDPTQIVKERNVSSFALPGAQSLQLALSGGIGYDIDITERVRITPEITYSFGLTGLVAASEINSQTQWTVQQIRGGVAVSLPLPKPPLPPPPPPVDTAKPSPVLAVKAFGLPVSEQAVGNTIGINEEQPSVILRVQQTISRSVFPLLPYIFFDGIGATALSERYSTLTREETKTFRESKLSSAYELTPKEHSYYNVLNVVGERLRRLPKAVLSIHGCTDGFTAERDKADVAKARAQVVMRYLRDVWQIPATQLKLVDNTTAPTTPSIPLSDADKQAENRRVELRSDTPEILANITLIDTVRRVSPPSVRFRLSAANIDSVRSWKIVVRQSGTIVKELRGTGALAEVQDWRMDERELAALHLDESVQQGQAVEPLEYTFSCIDADGNLYRSATAAIPLETRTEEKNSKRTRTSSYFAGKLVERFNLILFDFAKSTITSEQEPMMNLMRTRITERSTVRVDGFTDRTGEAEFNRKLSLQRALGVAQALGFTAEQQKTNVMGYGSSLELYNNDLPEGRFYSRTVRVIVETPQNE